MTPGSDNSNFTRSLCSGKTTQLRIIAGKEEADGGSVIKAAANMKIAFLSQEFEVVGSRTLREEFMSVFGKQMAISARIEKVQVGTRRMIFVRLFWKICVSVCVIAWFFRLGNPSSL